MKNYFLVFTGGGIGASLRYWLSGAIHKILPASFPFGTLFVNLMGCFAIGFLMTILEEKFISDPSLKIFLTIGILGGFTTFSSFSFESIALLRDTEILFASLNIITSILGCLIATIIGILVGRLF